MRKRISNAGRPSGIFPFDAGQGFTLIELLLVLVIISIALALVAPAIGNRLGGGDPKRTATQLRTTLELLRLRAITDGSEQHLIVDPQDNQYWQESGRQAASQRDSLDVQTIPSGGGVLSATSIWVRDTEEVEFRFYPDGTNSGGEIVIEQRRGVNVTAYTISLNPLLGTATVHYGES